MLEKDFLKVSKELDSAGLVWNPVIGDEVAVKPTLDKISILVDPTSLTPKELRMTFLWLPSVEQIVEQIEARQALIFHAGVTENLDYLTVIKFNQGVIEVQAQTLRSSFGQALKALLLKNPTGSFH